MFTFLIFTLRHAAILRHCAIFIQQTKTSNVHAMCLPADISIMRHFDSFQLMCR